MATVLIVDDSRTSRKILRNILTEHGYEIVGEAGDGHYRKLHSALISRTRTTCSTTCYAGGSLR